MRKGPKFRNFERKGRKLDVQDARYANRNFKKGHKKDANGQNQTQNTFKFACHSCGKTGHKAKECKSKKKFNGKEVSGLAEFSFSSIADSWCLD